MTTLVGKRKREQNADVNQSDRNDTSSPMDTIEGTNVKKDDEYAQDSSDEEDLRNTVGSIPMKWYDDYDHIGYDTTGEKIGKPAQGDQLDELIERNDNPDYFRTVRDASTGQKVVLSNADVELVKNYTAHRFVSPESSIYPNWVDFFTHEPMLHPVTSHPPQKRSFIPSLWEKKQVGVYVDKMKRGYLVPKDEETRDREAEEAREPKFFMLWKNDDFTNTDRYRQHISAPKAPLPGHAESYNPPPEYLFTEEELEAWKNKDPERRRLNFIPTKYSSIRRIPSYEPFVKERFSRCVDLYLCPRKRIERLNVEPEDLLPDLPKPRDLQPFPTVQSLVYRGHTGFVKTISLDPTGQWMVSGSYDKTVRFWEISTGRCMKTITFESKIQSVAWNPNSGLSLVAVVVEKSVIIINPGLGDKAISENTDNMISSYTPPANPVESPVKLDWHVYTEEEEKHKEGFRIKITHTKDAGQVSWHAKGDYFSVLLPKADSMSVLIHQLSKRRSQKPFSKSLGLVQSILFHPIRPFFFVATQRSVRVYNLLQQKLVKKLMSNCRWISSMAIHPAGDNVIIGSYDCRVMWFDLDLSTKPYQTLRKHGKAIRHVAFHKKYPLFASVSDDASAIVCHGKVYNDLLKNPLIVPVKILKGHSLTKNYGALACEFHPTQPWLLTSGADSTIRLFT